MTDDAWRPIETAPKDGTVIDAWAVSPFSRLGYRLVDVKWGHYDWHPLSAPDCWLNLRRDDDEPWRDRWQPVEEVELTHWMPLPPPPAGEHSPFSSRPADGRAEEKGDEI